MSFVPIEEIKEKGGISLTPMIDFLFLMLAFFASLAVSRVAMKDTELSLVKTKAVQTVSSNQQESKLINIDVLENGEYRWVSDLRDHSLLTPQEIAEELAKQYSQGALPEDKLKTKILLRIDKNAKWEPILKAILSIREVGFEVRPVYEPEE